MHNTDVRDSLSLRFAMPLLVGVGMVFLLVAFVSPQSKGFWQQLLGKPDASAQVPLVGENYIYTYQKEATFNGSKEPDSEIYINDQLVDNNASERWATTLPLQYGENRFVISSSKNKIGTVVYERHGVGDIDFDGDVDVFDLGILVPHFAQKVAWFGEPRDKALSDINGDGYVSVFDVGIFAGYFQTITYTY